MEASMSTATELTEQTQETSVERSLETQVSRSAPTPAGAVKLDRLFNTVLLETSGLEHRRRRAAAVLSFLFQCLVLGILLVVPLMFTDVLPQQQLLTFLVAPPPPPPPPPLAASEAAARVIRHVESDVMNGRLRAPSRIPKNVQMIREEEAPPELSGGGVAGGVPGGIPGGQIGGVLGGILSSASKAAAIPKLAAPTPVKRVRVSQGVTQGRLILKVEPAYPTLAKAARVEGQVVLTAIISKTGEIQNLELVSGHPLLVPAPIAAVKQWRYRPVLLNGEPVEVDTTITVNFQLFQ
jgi:periplasmic protein TonB